MTDRARYTINDVSNNTFYQLPKFLFDDEFASLSNDDRVLYSIIRDRHELSVRNGWCDENQNVYVYFKREDMQAMLRLSENTILKSMSKLKAHGLLDEVRQGRGKPNRIYLLNAVQAPLKSRPAKSEVQEIVTRKMCGSKPADIEIPDPQNVRFLIYNKTYNNKTDTIHTESSQSGLLEKPDRQDGTDDIAHYIEKYTAQIKENIDYNSLLESRPDHTRVDEIVAIILDVLLSTSKTIRIDEEDKPREQVKQMFLRLNSDDINHVIDKFLSITYNIGNKKRYITTMLYNSKHERGFYRTNAILCDRPHLAIHY